MFQNAPWWATRIKRFRWLCQSWCSTITNSLNEPLISFLLRLIRCINSSKILNFSLINHNLCFRFRLRKWWHIKFDIQCVCITDEYPSGIRSTKRYKTNFKECIFVIESSHAVDWRMIAHLFYILLRMPYHRHWKHFDNCHNTSAQSYNNSNTLITNVNMSSHVYIYPAERQWCWLVDFYQILHIRKLP